MGFFGDIIVPTLDPFQAAVNCSVGTIQPAMQKLGEIAEHLGLGHIWAMCEITGTSSMIIEQSYHHKSDVTVGVGMDCASDVGAGIWRDFYIDGEIPAGLRDRAVNGPATVQNRAQQLIQAMEPNVKIRGAEIDALRQIAEAASTSTPFQ